VDEIRNIYEEIAKLSKTPVNITQQLIMWVYIQDWSIAKNCIYVGINTGREYS
jgi:hypothetical protein